MKTIHSLYLAVFALTSDIYIIYIPSTKYDVPVQHLVLFLMMIIMPFTMVVSKPDF